VRITNFFVSEKERLENSFMLRICKNDVVGKNTLNMELLMRKFAAHYYEIYNDKDIGFLERECRLLFITYLRAAINGVGFYHLESEVRENKKIDVIVDYGIEQFVVELKLWYGEVAHVAAYEQLAGYLKSKNKDIGFLLTFDFRKNGNVGEPQFKWVEHKGKKIFDVTVGY
jgi:hypothetical protein